jgi:sigma-B regulation protein RsbU (phosphoserine phosphatase)
MQARRSAIHRSTLAWTALAALFVISVAYFSRIAYHEIDSAIHADTRVRYPFYLGDANWGILDPGPEAKSVGIKRADKLLTVEGRPIDGFVVYYGRILQAKPGDTLHVQVQTGDEPQRDVAIPLRPLRESMAGGFDTWYGILLLRIAVPFFCIALGFWVAAIRIRDRAAWLLLAVLLSLAAFLSNDLPQEVFGHTGILPELFLIYRVFFNMISPAALMLFGITFPERLAFDRRFPWFTWLIVGHLTVTAILESVNVATWTEHLGWSAPLQAAINLLTGRDGDFGAAVFIIAVLSGVGALIWKTVTTPSRDARRRLLILDIGAALSVFSYLVFLIESRWFSSTTAFPIWLEYVFALLYPAFPLAMAYAIVVHRAMDVRVFIRQGVQYLFATRGVRVLQVFISIAIVIAAATMSQHSSVLVRILVISAGFALLAGIRGFAQRLRGWIDRRFFREAYETDAILTGLASQIRTMVDTGPLLETVASRIAESLHVPGVAILLDAGGSYRLAHAIGYATPPRVEIPGDGVTVHRLQKAQHTIVSFDDADSWLQHASGSERRALEQLKAELLLPLSLNEKILGIMSLGPKQSEEPYSGTDLRLLDSVAAQTGLALENGRLTDAIRAEVAEREKQKRELEIAHEVQNRLFPQSYPPMPGLDYAGACRPAMGVGGDYYDFIPLSKTQLGIAIGDVSGKGIPAALLMATLRAFLRGQTTQPQPDLTLVMTNLNRLVYESSPSSKYATFFYGEFDCVTREMNYVNAGHNPPMVFRKSGEVVRLETGGSVIGLMPVASFDQGKVTLEPGDVFVAYTDGISEAMNAADDEWGEENMIECVSPSREFTATALIDRLMVSADEFVAGAPQHDDMTVVVARLTQSQAATV